MSAPAFDPNAIMEEVFASAHASPPATTATLRQSGPLCRNVATVATPPAQNLRGECRNVAIVATGDGPNDESAALVVERASLCADSIPIAYLDTWARLNCQRPMRVSETEWRLALDDGGRFLDAWGNEAAKLGWTAGDLFNVPRDGRRGGLIWFLAGEKVEAFGLEDVRFSDGRTIERNERAGTMARNGWRGRLEDGLKLDLSKLMRDGAVRAGENRESEIAWLGSSGEPVASGRIAAFMRAGAAGWLELEIDGRRQEIALESQPRHFGGRQSYFVCPKQHCLVSALWRPYGASYFASRQAWGRRVAYGSQFETQSGRAITGARRIRRRLGGKDWQLSLDAPLPEKPKGMHWRTYEREVEKCERYEDICNQHLALIIGRLRR